jgi:YHS domain-containing protein
MVVAALAVDGVFSALGLVPSGPRPSRDSVFGTLSLNYKLVLNVLGTAVFAVLFWLTARRGATDPVCGMTVDRSKALTAVVKGETYYFCSAHCRHAFHG